MPSPEQLRRLVAQLLGREPAIGYSISHMCPSGWPAVIISDPYGAGGRPNPNIHYLLCPHLRKAIARLEDQGFTGRLQQRINSDPDLAAELTEAQRQHALRWQAAAAAASGNHIEVTAPRIAASGGDLLLKCLHAHFAWYLAHPGYRIGRLIAGELGDGVWCRDETCLGIFRKLEGR